VKKNKVLYIAGWGRSGTTLIANLLGQMTGWFSAGELNAIWQFSLQEKARCGCKTAFRDCKVWREIFSNEYDGFEKINTLEMQDITYNETRSLRLPWFFISGSKCRNFPRRKEYMTTLEKLYSGIARRTQCKVIVDSSKSPIYAGVLRQIPSIDLYVVHVVRDPRAVAFSWLTKKENDEFKESLYYRSPFNNVLNWNSHNLAAEYFGILDKDKYLRVRYEDFVSKPEKHLLNIIDMLGETNHDIPIEGKNGILVKPTHTVWGNPSRFDTGSIELKADIRWKSNLSTTNKFLTTLFAFPLMKWYGYKINW
jgi:hypothetical protein